MGALTDVGDQALVEDEHLSIPAVVNWTVMVRPNIILDDGAGGKGYELADQVFMVGGRAGEHTGTFLEAGFGGGATGGAGGYGNMQMFNSWDMGDMKVGATIWSDGFGEDSGLQLMSVWGQHGGMLGGKGLSINNSMGAQDASGITGWVGTDSWSAQLALVDIANAGAATDLKYSPVVRGNYFLEAGDWEVGLGAIAVSGSPVTGTDTKRFGVDVQAFGEVGDMQIGVFADYASAAAGSATTANFYNTSTKDARTGYSFRVSVKPTHNIILLAGVGSDTQGVANAATVTTDTSLIGVEWEAYQNFAVQISSFGTKVGGGATSTTTALDLELLI